MSNATEIRLRKFRPNEHCEVAPGLCVSTRVTAAENSRTTQWFTGNCLGELVVFIAPEPGSNSTGEDLARESSPLCDDPIEALAVSCAGDKVAVASDKTVSLWQLNDRSEISGCSMRFVLPVTQLQFSPDDSSV